MTPDELYQKMLRDMSVELSDMFDRNFEKKGYFGKKWVARKNPNAKGTLLLVSGAMRRSIRKRISGHSLFFTSHLPYPALHNEGATGTASVREHVRINKATGAAYRVKPHPRNINIPRRQFLGNHAKVQQAIRDIHNRRMNEYFEKLAKTLQP